MKRVTREILRAYIIVAVHENPHITCEGLREMLDRQLKTNLRGLRFHGGMALGTVRHILGELSKSGILIKDSSRLWSINLGIRYKRLANENKRMKFYRQGLSDSEIARREKRASQTIRLWRICRRLAPNYRPFSRGVALQELKIR